MPSMESRSLVPLMSQLAHLITTQKLPSSHLNQAKRNLIHLRSLLWSHIDTTSFDQDACLRCQPFLNSPFSILFLPNVASFIVNGPDTRKCS